MIRPLIWKIKCMKLQGAMHKKSIIETINDGNTSLTFFYDERFSCELYKIKAGRFKSCTFGTKAGCRHHFDEAVNITLTQDFYIGVTPVKIYQYNSIINNNYCDNNFKEDYTGISWFGAKAYLDILNVVFENQKPSGFKFDLPSEAQLEMCYYLNGIRSQYNIWQWVRDEYTVYEEKNIIDPFKTFSGGDCVSKNSRSMMRMDWSPFYACDDMTFRLALVPVK